MDQRRLKILVVGHSCSPAAGSEPGATWHWARSLAALGHKVWLIAHPQYREHVEVELQSAPVERLQICWVELPKWLDPWDPNAGEQGLRLHYLLWQRFAFHRALKLHAEIGFDIVHQVGLSSVSTITPFWRVPVPFVWGPVGGGQVWPSHLIEYLGPAQLGERLRSVRVKALAYLPPFRRAVQKVSLILASNRETEKLLSKAGARRILLMPDNGVRSDWVLAEPPKQKPAGECTLIWVGRMEPHKGPMLALEAFRIAASRAQVRLWMVGAGRLLPEMLAQSRISGLSERVKIFGVLPHREVRELFLTADALLFTSLRESFGTVVLEAAALGLPVIALNHQGAGWFLPREGSIKVPVGPRQSTIRALAEAISEFCSFDSERRVRMGIANWRTAREEVWERRAERATLLYEQLLGSGDVGVMKAVSLVSAE